MQSALSCLFYCIQNQISRSHLFEKFEVFFFNCENLVAQHKMQSNRLIYRTLDGGPFSILAMNECVNDIRINLLPQKGRARLPLPPIPPKQFSMSAHCSPPHVHGDQMQTIFRHAQPHSVVFMAQQAPFHLRETEKHLEKPKHCVKKQRRTSASKLNSNQFDFGDLVFGWRRTFYKWIRD